MAAKRGGLAVVFIATGVALASCSGGGIGQKLASSLEECSSAMASDELSLGQVLDGRSTTGASLVVAENMRDEVSKARDEAANLTADSPDEQRQRMEALSQMDQALAAALLAHDALGSGDQRSLQEARQRLQQLDRDISQHAQALKGES